MIRIRSWKQPVLNNKCIAQTGVFDKHTGLDSNLLLYLVRVHSFSIC